MHKYRLVTYDTRVPMDDAEVIATFHNYEGALHFVTNWKKLGDRIDFCREYETIDIYNVNNIMYAWLEVAA